MEPEPKLELDFKNTEIAFSHKSDKELKKMARLFRLMNNPALVKIGSALGLLAINLRLPFSKYFIKQTLFDQFVGGENLLDCQGAIDHLFRNNALTMLDYGAEGKSTEEELNHVMNETIRAIEFAAANTSVPVVSTKITGLVDNVILEKLGRKEALNEGEQRQYEQLRERVDNMCSRASELGVGLFVDAEESWIQDPIDDLVDEMMAMYNHDKAAVYNTYQLYRKDKLQCLKNAHKKAKEGGYILGAKLVRGAYMDKERDRAEEYNYPSPINETKAETDKMYNDGVRYCVENYETIASCNASHNTESNRLQANLIHELGIVKNHPHLNFCQLFGMSDNLTFNLAEEGFNVAKYVPYGPVKEVVPYLIRRAKENSSVTGEMSRELGFIDAEIKRRGL